MNNHRTDRSVFELKRIPYALALVVGFTSPGAAFAQSDANPCETLGAMVDQAKGELRQQFSEAPKLAGSDDKQGCTTLLQKVKTAGGIARQNSGSQSETVELQQDATIDGEVQVNIPEPEVSVERDPANVSVTTLPPDVTVDQGQPVVTVRQAKPIISVEMSQPSIKIEQPAPEITITMPDPGVDVATRQPKVDVNIPEPRVTVRQGDPNLNVDLSAQADSGGSSGNDENTSSPDQDGMATVEQSGLDGQSPQPNIEFSQGQQQAAVNVKGAEPKVEFESATPEIKFTMVGEKPNVEIVDSGTPKVTIKDGSGNTESSASKPGGSSNQQNLASTNKASVPSSQAMADAVEKPKNAEGMKMAVSKLTDMTVVNEEGTELGSINRVVRNGGDAFVIMKHGGWLFGLNGKEVAMPVSETFVRNEKMLLRGMSEEQIKSLPEYSYADETVLGDAETVEVMQSR